MKNETFVSIILVVKNQAKQLINYLDDLCPYLKERYSDYEIVIIDQNSFDATETELDKSLSKHQSIRYIRLTQEVTSDVALAAGLENAIGDFVVNLNVQKDSFTMVEYLVDKGLSGSDIVVCVSGKASTYTYKTLRKLSTKLLRLLGYSLPSNSTGTFCFSRRSINALTESGRFYRKLYVRIANIGYPLSTFDCDCYYICEKKKSIVSGIKETLHHMVFNSTKPLRWMSALGVFGSIMAMLFSFYSIIIHLVNDRVAPGWTTTILFLSFLFAILFTMLSFFGEYLARLLDDRSEHKEYNVIYEKNSSVMINENRNNVLFTSTNENLNKSQTGRNK